MEIADAHKVLRVLQAAFPQYPNAQGLPEDTVELYIRMLTETNARGEDLRHMCDAMEAAATWVRSEDQFPTVGQLLDGIQAKARKRASAAHAGKLPPAWAGLPPEDLPQPPVLPGTLDESVRLSNVDRLREIVRGAVKRVDPKYIPPGQRADPPKEEVHEPAADTS